MSFAKNRRDLAELCVYGFIRMHYEMQPIPDVLKQICVSMYLMLFDAWDVERSHSNFDIDEDGNILKIKKGITSNNWINAFGKVIMTKGEIQQWNIKIINGTDVNPDTEYFATRAVMFGIINIENINDTRINSDFFCETNHAGGIISYAYYSYDGDSFHYKRGRNGYGKKWGKYDIITMTLDMTETKDKTFGHLSFKKNNVDQGILASNIDLNKQYCMALSIIYDDEIELLQDENLTFNF
eukprot:92004_1